jgi:hypothetical protein
MDSLSWVVNLNEAAFLCNTTQNAGMKQQSHRTHGSKSLFCGSHRTDARRQRNDSEYCTSMLASFKRQQTLHAASSLEDILQIRDNTRLNLGFVREQYHAFAALESIKASNWLRLFASSAKPSASASYFSVL